PARARGRAGDGARGAPPARTAAGPASRVPRTAASAGDGTGPSRVGQRDIQGISLVGVLTAREARPASQVRATPAEIQARPAGAKRTTLQGRAASTALPSSGELQVGRSCDP